MQTREAKRKAAQERTKCAKWEDSKAKRLGTMTQVEWNERREAQVAAFKR